MNRSFVTPAAVFFVFYTAALASFVLIGSVISSFTLRTFQYH